MTNRTINGIAETRSYDALGRKTSTVNALGAFSYAYDGTADRILDVSYPNGQTSHYDYFGNAGDFSLQRITHKRSDGSQISRFTHAYDPFGSMTNWVQEMAIRTDAWAIVCDAANQLLNVSATVGGMPTNYTYAYDAGGNRLLESIGGTTRNFTYNALNQLISSSDPAATNATYEWDADQKLTAINTGPNRSEFSYDGLARLSRIVEKSSSVPVSEKRFIWSSETMCQERAADNSLVKQFFSQGVMLPSGPLYYARDHLGSVREVTDAAGTLRAEYAYQPYGRVSKLAGDLDVDFGFTGLYRHTPSGLLCAFYRAYDPANARWVTRDPLGEYVGSNLYRYVDGSPINFSDTLGLKIQVAEADKADYEKAVAYLKKDSEMARIFKQLEDSDIVYKIITNDNDNDAYYVYNHSISWDPHSALRTSCGGKQSPALGLGHEADHAAGEDEQLARTKSNKYQNFEERRVIRGSEVHAAKTLGEDERFDHDGSTYRVDDPTKR